MKILSIGNSFSVDAQRYLHQLAENEGENLACYNLYIGGCPLKRHWDNWERAAREYAYIVNGGDPLLDEKGEKKLVSIQDAVNEGGWDIITLQPASHDSGEYDTYQPFLNDLSRAVHAAAPAARQLIHETWAYEIDSTHSQFFRYGNSQETMYACLKDAYARAAEAIHAPIIPSGDVIQALRGTPEFNYAAGGQSLCRDGFHMHLIYGRYALAVVWFTFIFQKPVQGKGFRPEGCGEENEPLLRLIREKAAEVILK